MNAQQYRFSDVEIGDTFLYRNQLYRKICDEYAALLRFDNGEYLSEQVDHRFEHHLLVQPVSE